MTSISSAKQVASHTAAKESFHNFGKENKNASIRDWPPAVYESLRTYNDFLSVRPREEKGYCRWLRNHVRQARYDLKTSGNGTTRLGDLNRPDRFGSAPLHLVIERHPNDVRLIRQLAGLGANLNQANRAGYAPLHLAILQRSVPALRTLLELGADANCLDNGQRTPLNLLNTRALGPETEVVDLLLKGGADIEKSNSSLRTPLQSAVLANCTALSLTLLERGANPRARGASLPVLHEAAYHNRKNLIAPLLAHGAAIDELDGKGATALWYAAAQESHQSVSLLLEHGANPHLANAEGVTPWQALVATGRGGPTAEKLRQAEARTA